MKMKLTKKAIEGLEPKARPYEVWDTELTGLVVWVRPSGRKTYAVYYRTTKGKRRTMRLGPAGAMPPTEARKAAKMILADVAQKRDPLEERREARVRTMKLNELWPLYEKGYLDHPHPPRRSGNRPLSPRTRAAYRWYWTKYLEPAMGERRLDSIAQEDVETFHSNMASASVTNANRTLALLGSMYTFAERSKILPPGSNPTHGVERTEENKRQRFLTADELMRLGEALREAEGREPWQALAAIRLLLLTGARRSEVLAMQWQDLDLERMVWNLPSGKTGARPVFLNAPAVELLASLPRTVECPWVLPGRRPTDHFKGVAHPWERIRDAAGLTDFRMHDIRHTAASLALAGGAQLKVIQVLLGHRELKTTSRYAHLADGPVRQAADRLGETVASALEGRTRGEVVQHPAAAGGEE